MGVSSRPVLGMILKGYPRISETFISNEILLLEKLGFEIHIFSMRKPRESFQHKSVDRIKARVDYLPETIRAHLPLLLRVNLCLAICNPRRYGKALKLALRRFARTRKTATFKHLLQAGLIVKHLLPPSKVSHLHAHFAHSPTSVAMFTGILSRLPFSFTAHAKDIYTSHPGQLAQKIKMARFVVTCTEYNRRFLMHLSNRGRTPIYRIYHGIDLNLFNGGGGSRQPASPYHILTVARLTPKKGIPTVLAALKKLMEQGIKVRYTLIGDGDERESVLARIDTLGLAEICRWLGTLPHHEVLAQYQQADLFVLGCEVAQNGDRDGIPNVLVESMAMQVPVVATDVSAISELIQHDHTGLLVPPGRPDLMAAAMARFFVEKDLRTRIVAAAKERVQMAFDNTRLVGSLADIYSKYLK